MAGNLGERDRRSSRGALRRSLWLLVGVALILASCRNGAPVATDGSPPGPSVTDSGVPAAEQTFPLLAGGPTDEIFPGPPADKPYELLSAGRCRELLDMTRRWGPQGERDPGLEARLVYGGAANACLFRWDEATADLNRLRQLRPDFTGCAARRAALQWFEQLVEAHQKDPGFAPTFVRTPSRGTGSDCITDPGDDTTGQDPAGSDDPGTDASPSPESDPSPAGSFDAGEGSSEQGVDG